MSKSLGLVFWGILLAMLDFRINGFDLLPDFLGYLLVAIGCTGLISASSLFKPARLIAWILVIFELASLAGARLGEPISSVDSLLDLVLIWCVLGGVIELAVAQGREDLARRATVRRKLYLIATLISFLMPRLFPRGFESAEIAGIFSILLVVFILVLAVLILHVLYQAKSELHEGGSPLAEGAMLP